MRTRLLPLIVVISVLAASSDASAFILDRFTDALPANPCLPQSGQPVVFDGPFCDGTSCPPDPLAPCAENDAVQTGLSGVFAGTRRTAETLAFGGTVTGRIDPVAARFHGSLDVFSDGWITLSYGTPYQFTHDADALNLNLPALGVSGVEFVIEGGPSPATPLYLWIFFLADAASSPRPWAPAQRAITAPGTVFVPLTDFTPSPGFTMSDVDDIQFIFSNCESIDLKCSEFLPAVDFALGPIEFVAAPTPASPVSWGRVKAAYR